MSTLIEFVQRSAEPVVSKAVLKAKALVQRVLPNWVGGNLPGEQPLMVFVSSVMSPEMTRARTEARRALEADRFIVPWMFEYTPASSEPLDKGYLRKVREADLVLWLIGRETTAPVENEVREAVASGRRLIAVRLDSPDLAPASEALLNEVKAKCKFTRESNFVSLSDAIRASVREEVVRAVRGKTGLGRLGLIDALGRQSRARCLERWLAVGVSLEIADELHGSNVGASWPLLDQRLAQGLAIIVGDLGSGKSLVGERIVQKALMALAKDSSAPLPAFIRFRDLDMPLERAVRAAVDGLGDPLVQGVVAVVDGLDEPGSRNRVDVLAEARVLAHSWPKSTVVVASRPLPLFEGAHEVVSVPRLEVAESLSLISRISNRPTTPGTFSSWSPGIREAAGLPLFALLIGGYYGQQRQAHAVSRRDLVASIVEGALSRSGAERASAERALRGLAVRSLERGRGNVPSHEVATGETLDAILGSRLVSVEARNIFFPLQILVDWFAAQSLLDGVPEPERLVENAPLLDQWREALTIACGSLPSRVFDRYLTVLAKGEPAVASRIVRGGVSGDSPGLGAALPPVLECGERLLEATSAWCEGLGKLAAKIGPVGNDGSLLPLGVKVHGDSLVAGWYKGQGQEPRTVFEITGQVDIFGPNWDRFVQATPAPEPAWAWWWSLEDMGNHLGKFLELRLLVDGSLGAEAIWDAAICLSQRGGLDDRAIPLEDLESVLGRIPECERIVRVMNAVVHAGLLRDEVRALRRKGRKTLRPPWPIHDVQRPTDGWVWNMFSPERLREKVSTVFGAALEGYESVVRAHFPHLASGLGIFMTLPAVLKGTLVVPPSPDIFGGGPQLAWHLEPLPEGSRSGVDIVLSDTFDDDWNMLERVYADLKALRPRFAHRISAHLSRGGPEVFTTRPATELVYGWLWKDLSNAGWLNGIFQQKY